MKTNLKILMVLAIFFAAAACSAKKETVSKEKQEQIDKDKKDFEKKVD